MNLARPSRTRAGCDATALLATHSLNPLDWRALGRLRELGAQPTARRVVVQGKVITAAGVSAGIDRALALAARLAGDDIATAIQLGIEYDPEAPFDAGSPAKARPETVGRLRALADARNLGSPR